MDLPTLTVSGSPTAMGHAHGEHFRSLIQAFVQGRFDYLDTWSCERGRSDTSGVLEIGRLSMGIAAAWDPIGHAEHVAIAEAAGLEADRLFTAANLTDMRDALLFAERSTEPIGVDEGCSSLLIPADHTAGGQAIVGQTWDLNHKDVAYVAAIKREPTDGVASWSVSCVGCQTLMGINADGLVVGTTNIKTWGARPGVGYLNVLHRAIRTSSVAAASEIVRTAPRAGAHTYWLADAGEQAEWEAVPDSTHVRRTGSGPVFRTNHCVYDPYRAIEAEPATPSSEARFVRLTALTAGRCDHTVASVKAIFADRADGPLSINRYVEDGLPVATNANFLAVPAERTAWACRGPGDRSPWVRLDFG